MSLLFLESFDGADTAPGKWTSQADWSLTTSNPRNGTRALSTSGNGSDGWRYQVAAADEDDVFIVGFGYRSAANGGRDGSANNGMVRFLGDNGATTHISLTVLSNGSLRVRRGGGNGTILGTTVTGLIVATVYAFIEMKITLHDSTGTVDVQVNGVNQLSLTGQDTKNAGTDAVFDSIKFVESEGQIDDLYLFNSVDSGITGAPNNDFIGDCKVTWSTADTDATVQFDLSTGSDHSDLVDEVPPNTTDYVFSDVAGEVDMFNMVALADSTATVYGVVVTSYAAKDDAGDREYRHRIDSGGTVETGPDKAPGVTPSYATFWDIWQYDPDTGDAWTGTGVNDATFGVEVRDV